MVDSIIQKLVTASSLHSGKFHGHFHKSVVARRKKKGGYSSGLAGGANPRLMAFSLYHPSPTVIPHDAKDSNSIRIRQTKSHFPQCTYYGMCVY